MVAQANVLDANGFLIAHVHPHAWLSGAYYVRVPNDIRLDDAEHAGWLRFGGPIDGLDVPFTGEYHYVRPQEGMLVLFPFFYSCNGAVQK